MGSIPSHPGVNHTLSFEAAKRELRAHGIAYRLGTITLDEWCQRVHCTLYLYTRGAEGTTWRV